MNASKVLQAVLIIHCQSYREYRAKTRKTDITKKHTLVIKSHLVMHESQKLKTDQETEKQSKQSTLLSIDRWMVYLEACHFEVHTSN